MLYKYLYKILKKVMMLRNKFIRTLSAATLTLMIGFSSAHSKLTDDAINDIKQSLGMTDALGVAQKYNAMNVVSAFQNVFFKAKKNEIEDVAKLYTHYICTGKMRISETVDAPACFAPPTNDILVSRTRATNTQKDEIQATFKTMFQGLVCHNIDFDYGRYIAALHNEFESVQDHIVGAYVLAMNAEQDVRGARVLNEWVIRDLSQGQSAVSSPLKIDLSKLSDFTSELFGTEAQKRETAANLIAQFKIFNAGDATTQGETQVNPSDGTVVEKPAVASVVPQGSSMGTVLLKNGMVYVARSIFPPTVLNFYDMVNRKNQPRS